MTSNISIAKPENYRKHLGDIWHLMINFARWDNDSVLWRQKRIPENIPEFSNTLPLCMAHFPRKNPIFPAMV